MVIVKIKAVKMELTVDGEWLTAAGWKESGSIAAIKGASRSKFHSPAHCQAEYNKYGKNAAYKSPLELLRCPKCIRCQPLGF